MRPALPILIALVTLTLACGGSPAPGPDAEQDQAAAPGTNQAADGDAGQGMMPADAQHDMGINRDVNVSRDILDHWAAVKIRVVDGTTGSDQVVEIPLGQSETLGDSGLELEPVLFVPDFVMDTSGITSRSAEPNNPAVQVIIREPGKEDYKGWLFAAMPAIHPFPHDRYQVTLVEGVPAS